MTRPLPPVPLAQVPSLRRKPKKPLDPPVVAPSRLAALNSHLATLASTGSAAIQSAIAAGKELLAIRDDLKGATIIGKPTKKGQPGKVKLDRGAWTRWVSSPQCKCGRSWAFELMKLAERHSIWSTLVDQTVRIGINPTALRKAEAALAMIAKGGAAVKVAVAAFPDVRFAVPAPDAATAFAAQVTSDAEATEKAARKARQVTIEATLAGTPLALRSQDIRALAGDAENGEATAAEIAEAVYGTSWTAEQVPDLRTAQAVALLDPEIRERLRASALASRKRDLQVIGLEFGSQPDYVAELVQIVEDGRADSLQGAQKVRESKTYQRTMDKRNVWIPMRLRWLLAELPDIVRATDSHIRALKLSIKRGIERMEEAHAEAALTARETGHAVEQVFSQGQIDGLQQLLGRLADIMPDGICPACKAETETCGVCSGVGWVSHARYGAWEQGQKARAEVEA